VIGLVGLFLLGALLCLGALAAAVLMVVAPPGPRIPAERRRAPGAPDETALSRATDRTVGAIDRAMRRGNGQSFGSDLEQAGITMPPAAFVLMVICAAAVLGSFGIALGRLTFWSVVLFLLFALFAPLGARVLLSIRSARRRAAFADQLDDTLSLLSGSLRAGHSLLRAVDAVSQQIEAPTSVEFARVINETRLGREVGEALDLTAKRMRSDDFTWVAQAVAISQEAGGNLSDVLEQAGRTIRERNQIRRQVKALSAEGRISAIVLLLLPVLVLAALLLIQPGYFAGFFTNPFGLLSLGVAAVLMVIGTLWMRVMVRVKF
jgi:Flp pilus assembly protein TadB